MQLTVHKLPINQFFPIKYIRLLLQFVMFAMFAALLDGCGGGGGGPSVSVIINPSTAAIAVGSTQAFTATIAGSTNTAVTWSVKEGASGGTINSLGVYTAPYTTGIYHVVATSQAYPTKIAEATVTVIGTTRLLQVGDTWNYTGNGTFTTSSGQTSNFTFTLARTIVLAQQGTGLPPTMEGISLTMTLTLPSQTITIGPDITYFSQDPNNRDVMEVADNGGAGGSLRTANTPGLIFPGNWNSATSFTTDIAFSNGDTDQTTEKVTGTEQISTPTGTFSAWNVTENELDSRNGNTSATIAIVSKLGAPVKIDEKRTDDLGNTITYSGELASTNVPLN